MGFQTDDLTILALGILGDAPVDPDQPPLPLPGGIHLRWMFKQAKGFPLHGFYLFRRESRPRRPVCLSPLLGDLRPGSTRDTRLETRLGRLSSPQALVWTDDFAPSGTVEADGRDGLRFDLPPGVDARKVEVKIGFRSAGQETTRKCVDFRNLPIGFGPNPRREEEIDFDIVMDMVSGAPGLSTIEARNGGPAGLNTGHESRITLPCAASRVDLLLTSLRALRIEALNGRGEVLMSRELRAGELLAGVVKLEGAGIAQLYLSGESADSALLHEICYECPESVPLAAIEVRALAGKTVVARKTVQGSEGQTVSATLEGDGITAVEIAPGPAALVDLCYVPSKQGVTFGWGEVPGFTYPLCLPVAHEDYPCPGKPASFDEAQALAFSRVTYRAPEGWDQGFPSLHGQLEILVKGGPGSGPMAGRVNPDLIGEPLGPAPGLESLKVPKQRPLDLVLLASLQPAMAQMLGLYFTDASAEVEVPYDYLLLADPTGVLGGSAATALEWLAFRPDSKAVDAFLAAGKSIPSTSAAPVPPPGPARAYALPGAMMRSQTGDLVDAQANVGLWWDAPPPPLNPVLGVTAEEPNLPVLYYPWRAFLGLSKPKDPPSDARYHPLLWPSDPKRPDQPPRPLTVVLTTPAKPPPSPAPGEVRGSPEWPPPPISFHIVDSGLAEGWYSYRIVGQNIFGQHSVLGSPAEWYQWDPPQRTPPLPLPWYYEKGSPGHHSIHPFAVALLDKIPPPRPTGIEATCLDPLDRWVLQDEAYTKWRNDHKDIVGLRVSWLWTLAHMNQAPDTREFRIYYVPGRLNELPGGIGVDDLRRPTAWTKRLRAVGYDEHVELRFEASRDPQGRSLAGSISRASGKVVRLGGSPDLSGVQPFLDHLRLDRDSVRPDRTYKILGLDVAQRTVTLDGIPSLGDDSPWTIGRPVRRYEIFLIPPEFAPGSEFEPTLAESAVFAQIGISAVDDKVHTDDDPHWGVPPSKDRFGNEGVVGGPAAIFRVLQTPPKPPELPDYPDHKLWATAADYHSDSFFTFRWKVPEVGLKVHVLRALDDSLFQRDLLIRETREALDPVLLPEAPTAKTEHLDFFPDKWDRNDAARRQEAATAVNGIKLEANYDHLTEDAWMVLALLPGNEGIGSGIGLEAPAKQRLQSALSKRDWAIRSTRKDFLAAAPASFSPRTLAAYDGLSDPALRILAGLPGNEDAFAQITLEPLDPTKPETFDRRGPDDPPERAEDTGVRAYLDTLPGRATNRYFYRAVCVDGAHNRSGLSLSTPPVYLPKVVPPRTPVITKVLGGDREITLQWARNREGDFKEYRVYRAESLEDARDLRFMTMVYQGLPAQSGTSEGVSWVDSIVPGLVDLYYRIVAVDFPGNLSAPSAAVIGRAFDDFRPDPPTWNEPASGDDPDSLHLSWTSPLQDLRCLLQRSSVGGLLWSNLSSWMDPGIYEFVDTRRRAGAKYDYRLMVFDAQNRPNRKFHILTA